MPPVLTLPPTRQRLAETHRRTDADADTGTDTGPADAWPTAASALPSRSERSRLTHELLRRAADTHDPAEREHALGRVVELNCGVADAVASRYRDRGVALEDLQQAAYEGLVKAVRGYDHDRAEDLLTYAVPTMRGEVQRHFRDRSWAVRPPRWVQELQGRIRDAEAELRGQLGREPRAAEVCDHLGIGAAEHTEALGAQGCFRPTSLDLPVGGATTLGDLLADEADGHSAAEARCVLEPALATLGGRDARLVRLRFHDDLTQGEIAAELGISQTQVSRTLDRVLRRLRAVIDAPPGGVRPAAARRVDPTRPPRGVRVGATALGTGQHTI